MFHSTTHLQFQTHSHLPEGHCHKLKALTLVGCPSRCSRSSARSRPTPSCPSTSSRRRWSGWIGPDAHSLTDIRFLSYPQTHRAMSCAYCRSYGHHRNSCSKRVAAEDRIVSAGGRGSTAPPRVILSRTLSLASRSRQSSASSCRRIPVDQCNCVVFILQ
jgi:hypothetical protein